MKGERELGVATADLMEKVERVYGPDAEIRDALVLAEIGYTDEEGEECSAVEWFCTSERSVIREGLIGVGFKSNPFITEPGEDGD